MADAFNRKYKLTLGRVGGNNTVVLTEQHIEFTVGQSSNSELNSLEINIYNLSDSTVSLLDRKDLPVRLEVGYENSPLGLIFNGTKTSSYSYRSGTEIITHITAQEGAKEVRESRCSATLPKQVTLRQVLEEIIKQAYPSYGKNLRGDILDSKRYNAGISLSGSACYLMDTYCIPNGLEWTVLHGNLINVAPKNGTSRSQSEIVILSPSTGLIGSPEKMTKDSNNMDGDTKNTQSFGVRLKSLINHKLVAGYLVKLQDTGLSGFGNAGSLDGIYKIEKVTHTGSYEGAEWVTVIEAVVTK